MFEWFANETALGKNDLNSSKSKKYAKTCKLQRANHISCKDILIRSVKADHSHVSIVGSH